MKRKGLTESRDRAVVRWCGEQRFTEYDLSARGSPTHPAINSEEVIMSDREKLEELAAEFFRRHWCLEQETSVPTWDFSWGWLGAVPNYLLGGVYALLRKNELLYVGLGASRGGGIYQNRGLSRRLMSHVYLRDHSNPTGYVPRERWKEVDVIGTIGFEPKTVYLAPALEAFLIHELNPPENHMKRRAEAD